MIVPRDCRRFFAEALHVHVCQWCGETEILYNGRPPSPNYECLTICDDCYDPRHDDSEEAAIARFIQKWGHHPYEKPRPARNR